MKNNTVFITGGSQGIGKVIAHAFAKTGAAVTIGARTLQDVMQTVDEFRGAGLRCDGYQLDVRDSRAVHDVVENIVEKHQSLDVIVSCAGVYGPLGVFDQNDLAAWKETIEINLMGFVNVSYAVVPFMKRQRHGSIITLSGAGVGGKIKPNMSAYVTSKSGVVGFVEALAIELKEYNINVNAIAPGSVNTRLLDHVLAAGEEAAGKEFYEASKKQKASGGTSPQKAATLALYLCSEEGKYITGKMLSAQWDDRASFAQKKERLAGSLYTLRRVDDDLITGKK